LKDESERNLEQFARNTFNQPFALTNYLCHVSKKNKFLYVETPKVACTSVKRVLQEAELGESIKYENPGDVHNRELSPLMRPSDELATFGRSLVGSEYFRFCFVRNPFTRVLSCYLDKMVKVEYERRRLAPKLGFDPDVVPTFLEFLEAVSKQSESEYDIHWAPQTYLLRPNRVHYSFVGRFELFGSHFEMLCMRLGIRGAERVSSSWHATNAYGKVERYFDTQCVDLVCEIYESDFRNFGYGWSPEII